MADPRTHVCDHWCVCPIHETPLFYAPASGDHACQDPECMHAHGGVVPGPASGYVLPAGDQSGDNTDRRVVQCNYTEDTAARFAEAEGKAEYERLAAAGKLDEMWASVTDPYAGTDPIEETDRG